MNKAASWLRSMDRGTPTESGRDLSSELSSEEQKELQDYIFSIAYAFAEVHDLSFARARHGFSEQAMDELSSVFAEVLLLHLCQFNDPDHLSCSDKKYKFSTFISHLMKRALVIYYSELHQLSPAIEKKQLKIRKIRRKIAVKYQLEPDEIPAEMIQEYCPEFSLDEIHALLSWSFFPKMEEEPVTASPLNPEEIYFSLELSGDVKTIFQYFLNPLSDVELFFVLLRSGCAPETYHKKTVQQLSIDSFLILILRQDRFSSRFLERSDVVIPCPDRDRTGRRPAEFYPNTEHAAKSLINYQMNKAATFWKSLGPVLERKDLTGAADYLKTCWDDLQERVFSASFCKEGESHE